MDEGVVFALWIEDFGKGIIRCKLDALTLVNEFKVEVR
jgi:hypothetical protein